VFTARYGLSPYIKQKRFVFKKLIKNSKETANYELQKVSTEPLRNGPAEHALGTTGTMR
jgi:hypothetical protein